MKLLLIFCVLINYSTFAMQQEVKSSSQDKEVTDIVKTMIDSSISNAISQVGNDAAIENIQLHLYTFIGAALYFKNAKDETINQKKALTLGVQHFINKLTSNITESKPFLLNKNQIEQIDEINACLQVAIKRSKIDDVLSITQEFAGILGENNYAADKMRHAASLHQYIKQEEKQREEKSEYIPQEQQEIIATSQDRLKELDVILAQTISILDAPMNYEVVKSGLTFMEKAIKNAVLKDCKMQLRDITEEMCRLQLLHKNLKKIEKKTAKNKEEKLARCINDLVEGISNLLVQFGRLINEQKKILMWSSKVHMHCQNEAAGSSGITYPYDTSKTDLKALHNILKQINVIKKLKINKTTIKTVRQFVQDTFTTCLQDDDQIDAAENIIESSELVYNVVGTLFEKNNASIEHKEKIENCLQIMSKNFGVIINMMEESINRRLQYNT